LSAQNAMEGNDRQWRAICDDGPQKKVQRQPISRQLTPFRAQSKPQCSSTFAKAVDVTGATVGNIMQIVVFFFFARYHSHEVTLLFLGTNVMDGTLPLS
jgi:hypothetical protein